MGIKEETDDIWMEAEIEMEGEPVLVSYTLSMKEWEEARREWAEAVKNNLTIWLGWDGCEVDV